MKYFLSIFFYFTLLISSIYSLPDSEDITDEVNISHMYNIKSEHIHSNGYEFILYGNQPGEYIKSYAHDERKLEMQHMIFENDTFVLVKKESELIYYLSESYEKYTYPNAPNELVNTWSYFKNAKADNFLKSIDYPSYDVAIFEFSPFGAQCCGYLHLFSTDKEFKYLGKFDAFF